MTDSMEFTHNTMQSRLIKIEGSLPAFLEELLLFLKHFPISNGKGWKISKSDFFIYIQDHKKHVLIQYR